MKSGRHESICNLTALIKKRVVSSYVQTRAIDDDVRNYKLSRTYLSHVIVG